MLLVLVLAAAAATLTRQTWGLSPFTAENNYGRQDGSSPAQLTIGSLGAPSSLGAAASSTTVTLTWSAGTNGTGYDVFRTDLGLSGTCNSGTSFSSTPLASGVSATTYGDVTGASLTGHVLCYKVETAYGTTWTSSASNVVGVTGP